MVTFKILVAHQFVTGAVLSDSEEVSVGGIDCVDAGVFKDYDYVALGHIHGPQKVSKDTIRYCGTPLKYSFSEASHEKSVTVINIEGSELSISTRPLIPKRDLRKLRGQFSELVLKKNYENTDTNDFVQVTLTDEEDILDAMAKLRVIYPNIVSLFYDNARTRANSELGACIDVKYKNPMEIIGEFFEIQNNQPLNDNQKKLCQRLYEEIWGMGR